MNKRQRKKELKKRGLYIPVKECWNLDHTFAKYIVPRLKLYKEKTLGYPCSFDTIEEWYAILDKMILAFEYILENDDWAFTPQYDYMEYVTSEKQRTEEGVVLHFIFSDKAEEIKKEYQKELKRRNDVIIEGLDLFGKYFRDLWW